MNAKHDQLETIMGTGLRDRAADVDAAGPSFSDVRGRATSIRRHRRIGAGIGVAAALAIVVPLGINTMGSLDPERRVEPAGPTEVVRTTLTLDGLERGDAPGVEYFTADGAVLPDSGLQRLADSWQALVPSPADGGWLGLSPSRDEVVDLTDDFEQTSSQDITQTFVSNPDRSLVAWTVPEPEGQTLTLHSTTDPAAGMLWGFPKSPQVDPVDFLGDDSLLFQTSDPQEGSHEIGIAHGDRTTSMFEGDWVAAISASPETGLVAVQTRSKADASGCFGVVDPSVSTAATAWESCDHSLGAFSPDGRYILASDPYLSGIGITSLSVLDAATGELVTSFEQERGGRIALNNLVWESSDSIVAVALEGVSGTVLRLGVDGSLVETVDRVDEPVGDQPFFLGLDRRRGF